MNVGNTVAILQEWVRRAWDALGRNANGHDAKRELEFHLEMAEETLRRQGHSAEEAARLARLRFDTVPRTLAP